MSPAANTPGMFVSIVCDTLISPFSRSRPHWAMAPSEEMKPSCGITLSTATRSSSLLLLLKMVTASIASPPWIAFSSQKVRSSIFPAAHSSWTCRTVAAWARKPSRRWIIRMKRAMPWRFTAQSNAESPPPTSSTRFPANTFGSRMRSWRPFPYQRSASLSGSFRGVKAPIPPAMSTVRDECEARLAVLGVVLQVHHLFPQVDRLLELERLLGHPLHEVLGEHLGEA